MKKIKICIIIFFIIFFAGCSDEDEVLINKIITSMTLDEKIGQMILAGFDGTIINEELNNLVNENKVGGIILFKRNIESSSQIKKLINDVNESNKGVPLFVSIDEEGGRISRISDDMGNFKSASEIGKQNSTEYAYNNGLEIGKVLISHGINMDHAPVLDIYSNSKNTVIGDRAFGNDEDIVSTMGVATMKGIQDSGVIPTVKHFPGHGDTEVDSHFGLPIVSKTLDELESFEFIPFKYAIKNNCDVVMVSHIVLENIDRENPATVSSKIINGILRDNLGFNKVVITDDMNMRAITNIMSVEDASIKSIQSGSDVILIGGGQETVTSVIEKIKQAVEENDITEERINESLYRILSLKIKYSIIN
ncbi:beta-N-acetylhexosaminidase [Romboutsia sp. 1001713B170207_170306_H8]|uniref:beta-N-acetylhexosaminidase n=1 Tax=Romboutsia sp. 1001713B170207_170306_H8 TaxID=2787112 RepID=UPI0008217A87|nr:beta-N-acetylhexosaminidase [Romboutsia sp. 1001713B170207_170306_H8]SCH89315.1 beta-hexosaminidase [uncultured Clostridium sp.]